MNLENRAGLDLSWALNGYPVKAVKTPQTAEAMVNFHNAGRQVIFSTGGVKLKVDQFLKKFAEASDLTDRMKTPEEGFHLTVPAKQ